MNNKQIPSTISEKSIGLFYNGRMHSIGCDHPNFNKIKESLKNQTYDNLESLIDIPKSVTSYSSGMVSIDNGVIMYNGKALHNVLTRRILTLMNEGFGFSNMVKFLENIKENPSMRSVEQLYSFLEHRSLPITDDGHFLAFKAVKNDYMDKWTGKTHKNTVGSLIQMERNEVEDNPDKYCAPGLHCGAKGYVKGYHSGNDRIVIVKVNPKDVVSVPVDMGCEKLRTCRYEVVAELSDLDKLLERAVYTSKAEEIEPDEYNEEYADDYYGEEEFEHGTEEDRFQQKYEDGWAQGRADAVSKFQDQTEYLSRDGEEKHYANGYMDGFKDGTEEILE